MIYIKDNLPCGQITFDTQPNDIERIFLELNLRKQRWLIIGAYNPRKENISYFLGHVSKNLHRIMSKYENILILGDFTSAMSEEAMKEFCQLYDFENLIKEPTCYKNADNPTSIDVILTNNKEYFANNSTVETGISDHHKMVITVLRVYVKKKVPVTINYRYFENFDISKFRNDLKKNLEIFMRMLNWYAPMKKKVTRGNHQPFMIRTLFKEIRHRSKLKNKFNKNPTEENKILYKKQRNYCVHLCKKQKKSCYNNLGLKIFEDNKKFWQCIKPLFSDRKHILQRNIMILDKGEIITDDAEVAEKLNNFFIEAVESLDIEAFISSTISDVYTDDIEKMINQYQLHPSILKIIENVTLKEKFKFKDINSSEINRKTLELNPKMASIKNDIPAKILIESNEIVSDYLAEIYNTAKNKNYFSNFLKLGTITPIQKKAIKTLLKKDYRPVNLTTIVSKLYERNKYDQVYTYIDQFLSPYLFGYWKKTHSTEQCLTIMIETWKKALDQQHSAGGILTDLSKAYDCIKHNLLIAKLEALTKML